MIRLNDDPLVLSGPIPESPEPDELEDVLYETLGNALARVAPRVASWLTDALLDEFGPSPVEDPPAFTEADIPY